MAAERTGAGAQVFNVRTWHHCIGMFIAPGVVLLALTGIFQVFDLHEAHAGYAPPPLVAAAAALHKHQALPRPEKPGDASKPAKARPAPRYTPGQWALKLYMAALAAGLVASTAFGVVMSLRNRLRRRSGLIALALGTLLPLALLVV